ncbi:hypothetical protein C8J57DRAFT_2212 [Mycena rebaudengoi]|nr:hypothetical protein C8J57DRAFT_2212 [Mycena rebaudengoi]
MPISRFSFSLLSRFAMGARVPRTASDPRVTSGICIGSNGCIPAGAVVWPASEKIPSAPVRGYFPAVNASKIVFIHKIYSLAHCSNAPAHPVYLIASASGRYIRYFRNFAYLRVPTLRRSLATLIVLLSSASTKEGRT